MQESQLPTLWLTFLLCSTVLPPFTAAQPSSTTNSSQEDDSLSLDSATMAILVLVVVSAILFLGSFSLWIQNCCVDSTTSYSRSMMSLGSGSRVRQRGQDQDSLSTAGVDKAVIDSFPTIVYSAAKGVKMGVGSLECAVCLSEFSGDEILRMLPSCDHVFHLHCIARWLANHATCPVCRARVIDNRRSPIEMERNIPLATAIDTEESAGGLNSASASQSSRGYERFTLKLPDGVKEEIAKAKLKLKRSASCDNLTGVSGRDEGSGSQIGRWIGRSERWGSSVAPSDCLAMKGDGAGDRFAMLPV